MGDNCTESDVTWATAPVSGEEFAAADIHSGQRYYEWDITGYFKAELNQDGIISVCLQEHPGTNANIYFNSKEAADHHPQLVLSVTDTADAGALTINKPEFALNIYPNPYTGVLNVVTADGRIDHLSIYSLSGQMMLSQHDIGHSATVNIEHLEESIYLLKVQGDFGVRVVKLIKAW